MLGDIAYEKKAVANEDMLTECITRSLELKHCGVLKYQLKHRLVNPIPKLQYSP